MLQGMMLYSWSYANHPLHMFAGIQMVEGGYAGMEAADLLQQLKDIKKAQS